MAVPLNPPPMSDASDPPLESRPPANYQRWLAELKRRRVFRVIAVYGAVAFVVLEAADVIFPAIPLPAWAIMLVFWMIVLGFPVAVVLAWAFEVTPEGVRRTEAARPEEIATIVGAPARARWPSGLLALGGLVLFAVAFYGGRRSALEPRPRLPAVGSPATTGAGGAEIDRSGDSRPAIAVLAFTDMSPGRDQGYFSDGISEEILTVLSRIRELRVAARSSAFTYKDSGLDPTEIGDGLGVPYLLSGSVRREGDRVRISAELIQTADGFRIWSQTFERRLDGVFAVQSEIAEAISGALRVPLGLEPEALVRPTFDVDAHDLYLTGRAAVRRRGPGVGEGIEHFRAALALDSLWAPAWAGLADAHAKLPLYPGDGRESTDSAFWTLHLEAAERAARRALELDPSSAVARIALGGVHRDRWEWDAAERELQRALDLDPDNEDAHVQYAEVLWGMGRLEESLRETGRALLLDRTPLTLDVHGFVLQMNRRYAEAEILLEEGIAIDPAGDMHFLRTVLAHQLLIEGRYQEALSRFARFLPDTLGYRLMGEALASGDPSRMPARPIRGLAQTLALLGEEDRALDVLEEMVFALPFRVQYEVWDPTLAPLRSSPRFQEIILPHLGLAGTVARYAPPVSVP